MPLLLRICLKKDSRLNLLPEVKNNLKGTPMFFQIVLGMGFLSNRVAFMNFRLGAMLLGIRSINLTLYLFSPNLVSFVGKVE